MARTKLTQKSKAVAKIAFLFDVDNTVLDNDHVLGDLKKHFEHEIGRERSMRYWKIFEQLRTELGYADYLGALQRYRCKYSHDIHVLKVSRYLIDYPFANRLFPSSLDVLERAKHWGRVVLLSDGDVVFQPHKIERSGLFEAVGGHVLVYIHKQDELRDVQNRYPASHYVVIDDKLRVLTEIKKRWRKRVTTVFVRQGHYALDQKIIASCPPADITIERIGDLLNFHRDDFLCAPGAGSG